MPLIDTVEQATNVLSESDVLDKLNEPDDKSETTDEIKIPVDEPVETETEEETEDEDEGKIDIDEDEDEEPEDSYVSPVPRKAILAKYPNIFKEFPYLETAYYRSQKFTEVFPTIDDAKEALEASTTLRNFEQDIMTGSVKGVLKSVKENSPDTFNKLVDNYLQDLFNADATAYHHVTGNLVRTLAANMVREANTSGNDALKAAAVLVNQFMFGESNFKPPTNLSKEEPKSGKEDELKQKEMEFNQRQYNTALTNVQDKIQNRLKTAIDDNIDKSGAMSSYEKKNASRDCLEKVHDSIKQDKSFQGYLDRLWRDAFNKNFSEDSLGAIRKAYISKAQGLLPSAIKKARQEALGTTSKRVKEGEKSPNKTPIRPGRTAGSSKPSPIKALPKGMSMMDYLTSD